MPQFRLDLTDEEITKLRVLKAHTNKKSYKELFLWMADQTIKDLGLDEKPAFSMTEEVQRNEQ